VSEQANPDPDLARLLAVQRAVTRLASSAEAPEDGPAALVSWGVAPEDAAALGAYPRPRAGVYGALVAGTVLSAVKNQLPMTAARMSEEALADTVRAFLAERAPRSPYLRDVPFEVAMWAAPRWSCDPDLPACLSDLARHELLLFAASTTERGARSWSRWGRERPQTPARGARPEAIAPLAADQGVWLEDTVHLARFGHAVHLLPEDPADRTEPERRDVALLVYRDPDNEPRTLVLTAGAMEIVTRLADGAPLGVAITESAAALGQSVDAAWIEGISAVLADLADRGALLGARAPGAALAERTESSPHRRWLATGRAE
jgi:hypothetical protein